MRHWFPFIYHCCCTGHSHLFLTQWPGRIFSLGTASFVAVVSRFFLYDEFLRFVDKMVDQDCNKFPWNLSHIHPKYVFNLQSCCCSVDGGSVKKGAPRIEIYYEDDSEFTTSELIVRRLIPVPMNCLLSWLMAAEQNHCSAGDFKCL